MNQEDARDAILAAAVASLPEDLHKTFEDVPSNTSALAWARITFKHAGRKQDAMGDGVKSYTAFGVLCIEVFTQPGDGGTASDRIVGPAVLYLDKVKLPQIWYRNIRPVDIGRDGGFRKTNIYADVQYQHYH